MEFYQQHSRKFYRKLYLSAILLMIAMLAGVLGFMSIENYSLIDAFYMTIITLSTVGFTEVKPLSDQGQIFASFLIIFNIGIFAYAITNISSFFLEGGFQEMMTKRRMQRKIDKLKDHVIVCGYGRYGQAVVNLFKRHNEKFVVIDSDEKVSINFPGNEEILFLNADATMDESLQKAGIERAKSIICALPEDSDNVYVILSAQQFNTSLNIISRANSINAERKLMRAGAKHVVLANQIGGFFMAALVTKPDAVEFFTTLTEKGEGMPNFEEVIFDKIPQDMKGKTIKELDIRSHTGANVVGLKNPEGKFTINPSPDTVLKPNMGIIVLGSEEQIANFKSYMTEIKSD